MAANIVGDTRKRSNTGGSEDSEDRVVLLSGEDMSNVHSESDLSDNNEDCHSKKLISEKPEIFSQNRSVRQNMRRLYNYYCPQRYKKVWLTLFVSLLGVVLLVMVVAPLQVWSDLPQKTCSDLIDAKEFAPYIFDPNEQGKFALCRQHDKELLIEGTLGINHHYTKQQVLYEYEYSPGSILNFTRQSEHCVQIRWEGVTTKVTPLKDCFNLGTKDDYWFGGYQSFYPQWPIEKNFKPLTPFVPRDYTGIGSDNNFGPIIHPVWLSSKGVVIYVDRKVSLSVSFNNESDSTTMCLQAMPYSLNCMEDANGIAVLNYTVCGYDNMTSASQYFLSESGNVPSATNTPDSNMLKYPIWTTKDALYDNWTQTDVIDYARTIKNNNYNISLLEIDGKYSDYYGDLEFSVSKFPDITEFKNISDSLGIPVSAIVSPFIDHRSTTFTEAIANDTLYPQNSDIQGEDVVLVKWSDNLGAILNMMDDSVQTLYQARLHDFMSVNGLSTLSFDGGSETYIPRCVYSGSTMTLPTQYTTDYVNFVNRLPYSTKASVSVGYFNQNNSVLFRMLARNSSSWGSSDGLRSIIPSALALGLGGYSFVYSDTSGIYPSKELYVRWLQLVAFMPVMQISYPPWKYDSEVINHVKDLIRLHSEVYTNYIEPLISEVVSNNYPIIRPLWWFEPDDSTFITNNETFLVGESLLVAPVLNPSNNTQYNTKQVFFPSRSDDDHWKCLSKYCNGQMFKGRSDHSFKDIVLTDLLYFKWCKNDKC